MTDKKTEALKLALEALEEIHVGNMTPMAEANWNKAITAIREALAEQCVCGEPNTPGTHRTDGPCYAEQPASKQRHISYVCPQCHWSLDERPAQQEPVAWLVESKHGNWAPYLEWSEPSYLETQVVTPLYTSPTANTNADKPWVGLTDEEKDDIILNSTSKNKAVAKTEAKLKEKNK